ncbi:hypothetical protein SETIT_3G278100v2 [Setaria italica]|uniref:Uncharacterized protein n=1 Tax=Setaria italica TaxID=4555 RepID=A0A368QKA1_SETIT|nr:hypothetical protein SETIT_3G278100v2 [Setaria italica]
MGIVASYCCWCFPREDKPNYQEEVSSPDSKFRSHHDPPSPPVKEPNDGLDGSAAAAGDGSKKEADKASQNPPVFVYKNGDGGATDACNSDNRKASPDGVCGSKDNRKVSHTMGAFSSRVLFLARVTSNV